MDKYTTGIESGIGQSDFAWMSRRPPQRYCARVVLKAKYEFSERRQTQQGLQAEGTHV